jgi:starch synthase (maltosyl-transferring)
MPVRTHVKPQPRIRVEQVRPEVDCGLHPVKRTVGEQVEVTATVIRDGHDVLGARVLYRGPGKRHWSSVPLESVGNDLFVGSFDVTSCGRWEYAVEAWSDRFATWRDELGRKVAAGQEDLSGELAEGELLLGIEGLDVETALASTASDKHGAMRTEPLVVEVDREIARFGAWYELFPRSFGGFAGVERALPRLAELGFDVVYFPPIHPIGRTGRKSRNNTLPARRGDPGSPWAIGGKEGGHDAVHPDLGTLRDFDRLVSRAQEFGLEIALAFAAQC